MLIIYPLFDSLHIHDSFADLGVDMMGLHVSQFKFGDSFRNNGDQFFWYLPCRQPVCFPRFRLQTC
jgi:hypothetical protein